MAKILIVDDSRGIADELARLLNSNGHETIKAENGLTGLKTARNTIPDLIISETAMPGMDGLRMVKKIRSDFDLMTVPVIFLSSKNEPLDIREGMLAGADDYLAKPLNPSELLDSVSTRLDIKSSIDKKLNSIIHNIAACVPHQLRVPLFSVMGFTSLLNEDIENIPRRGLIELLNRIKISSEKLYMSSSKLMKFHEAILMSADKKLAGAFIQDKNPARPATAKNAALVVAGRYGRSGDLKMYLDDSRIRIVKDHLTAIVTEVVDNAFKFSEKGSKVVLKSDFEGGLYNITVTDEGTQFPAGGIEIPELDNINMSGSYAAPEMKLGLLLARTYCQLHDARISISRPDSFHTTVRLSFHSLEE